MCVCVCVVVLCVRVCVCVVVLCVRVCVCVFCVCVCVCVCVWLFCACVCVCVAGIANIVFLEHTAQLSIYNNDAFTCVIAFKRGGPMNIQFSPEQSPLSSKQKKKKE